MTLAWYRRPRLVVLGPNDPVLNAAKAMENNEIGALLVLHKGKLVGLLTDRDIAVRATAMGIDPAHAPLASIMSDQVVTLDIQASRQDALNLMRSRRIRRIPLVENEKLVGIVTLDDLILDEAAPIEEIATVLEAQLGEGGPATSPRHPAAMRSATRAMSTYRHFIGRIQEDTGLESFEKAETVVSLVTSALVQRLTDGEGQDFLSQLPSLFREKLGPLPPGPDISISRESIVGELVQRLDIDPSTAAGLLEAVGSRVLEGISSGQAEKVRHQLPAELRDAVSSAPAS